MLHLLSMKVLEYILSLQVNLAALKLMKTFSQFSPLFKWLIDLAIGPIINKHLQEILFLFPEFLVTFSQPTDLVELFPEIKLSPEFSLVLDEHSLANLPLNFSLVFFLQHLHVHD